MKTLSSGALSSQDAHGHDAAATPLGIVFDSVTKRFGDSVAVDNVSCEVRPGETHAFVGENGAGKSTLMKILSGQLQPDHGRLLLNGTAVNFRSPTQALRAGVGMVYQHFTLVPTLTALENVLLGDPRLPFFFRRRELSDRVEAEANRFGFHFDLSLPVWRLGMAERQKLEIFKLLWRNARVLILDEPTSQLSPFESEDVLSAISTLAECGRTILLVSHHLQDVVQFASRITVLRRGCRVATVDSCSTRVSDLATLMVGTTPAPRPRSDHSSRRKAILSLRDVSVRASSDHRSLHKLSLDIYPGEILGVGGVTGSGQEELAAVLTGHLVPDEGSLLIRGRRTPWQVLQRPNADVAHVPADTRSVGSIQRLSLLENLFLREVVDGQNEHRLFLNWPAMRGKAQKLLSALKIEPNAPDLPCSVLSGGNLQRLVLAREILSSFSLLVAVNPFAGLSVAAASEASNLLRDVLPVHECAKSGGRQTSNGGGRHKPHSPPLSAELADRAVILVSSDLSELLNCDRVLILCGGEVTGIENTHDLDAERLGLLMGGIKADLVRTLRSLRTAGLQTVELRAALYELLESPNAWRRRLALKAGFHLFGLEDVERLEAKLQTEEDNSVKAWLLLLLTRLGRDDYLDDVLGMDNAGCAVADRNLDFEFLRAQMDLLGLEDRVTLRDTILAQLEATPPLWQHVLCFRVLRVIAPQDAECFRSRVLDRMVSNYRSAERSSSSVRTQAGRDAHPLVTLPQECRQ